MKKHEAIAIAFAAASQEASYDKGVMRIGSSPKWIAPDGSGVAPENIPPLAEKLFDYAARDGYPAEALYNTHAVMIDLKPHISYLDLFEANKVPWVIFAAVVLNLMPFIESEQPPAQAAPKVPDSDWRGFGDTLEKEGGAFERDPRLTKSAAAPGPDAGLEAEGKRKPGRPPGPMRVSNSDRPR